MKNLFYCFVFMAFSSGPIFAQDNETFNQGLGNRYLRPVESNKVTSFAEKYMPKASIEEIFAAYKKKYPNDLLHDPNTRKIREAYLAGKFPVYLDALPEHVAEILTGESSNKIKAKALSDYLYEPDNYRAYDLAIRKLPPTSLLGKTLVNEEFIARISQSMDTQLFKARLSDACNQLGAGFSIANSAAGDGFDRTSVSTGKNSCIYSFLGVRQFEIFINKIDASKCSKGLCQVSYHVGCYGHSGLGQESCVKNRSGLEQAEFNIVGKQAKFVRLLN